VQGEGGRGGGGGRGATAAAAPPPLPPGRARARRARRKARRRPFPGAAAVARGWSGGRTAGGGPAAQQRALPHPAPARAAARPPPPSKGNGDRGPACPFRGGQGWAAPRASQGSGVASFEGRGGPGAAQEDGVGAAAPPRPRAAAAGGAVSGGSRAWCWWCSACPPGLCGCGVCVSLCCGKRGQRAGKNEATAARQNGLGWLGDAALASRSLFSHTPISPFSVASLFRHSPASSGVWCPAMGSSLGWMERGGGGRGRRA